LTIDQYYLAVEDEINESIIEDNIMRMIKNDH